MKVVAKIFHNHTPMDQFFRFDPKTSALIYAYDVVVEGDSTDELLIAASRAATRGSDIEQLPSDYRSLLVGDVVTIDNQPYACDASGWVRVSIFKFREAIARGVRVLRGKE